MTNILIITTLTATSLITTSCSTPSKNRIAATLGGFTVGAAIGAATAPTGERQDMHAMYWGGILGLGSAVASNLYFSEEALVKTSQLENDKMKAELELIQNANKVLIKEGKGYFKNSSGEEYFQTGKAKWRIYQVDKWSKDGPNRLFHQDRMVELVPTSENENDSQK
jgi:hypothetical protein